MRLSIQIEFDKTLDIVTRKTSVVVGRAVDADITVQNSGVSRQHCRIEYIQGVFYITDLGSSNGTFIDGQRLEPNVKTKIDSQFSLGSLDCEVSEHMAQEGTVVSTQVSDKGDFTSTIRVARLDLNQPSKTLQLEKKNKIKGPRNPVHIQKEKVAPKKDYRKFFILIMGLLILYVVWYLGN